MKLCVFSVKRQHVSVGFVRILLCLIPLFAILPLVSGVSQNTTSTVVGGRVVVKRSQNTPFNIALLSARPNSEPGKAAERALAGKSLRNSDRSLLSLFLVADHGTSTGWKMFPDVKAEVSLKRPHRKFVEKLPEHLDFLKKMKGSTLQCSVFYVQGPSMRLLCGAQKWNAYGAMKDERLEGTLTLSGLGSDVPTSIPFLLESVENLPPGVVVSSCLMSRFGDVSQDLILQWASFHQIVGIQRVYVVRQAPYEKHFDPDRFPILKDWAVWGPHATFEDELKGYPNGDPEQPYTWLRQTLTSSMEMCLHEHWLDEWTLLEHSLDEWVALPDHYVDDILASASASAAAPSSSSSSSSSASSSASSSSGHGHVALSSPRAYSPLHSTSGPLGTYLSRIPTIQFPTLNTNVCTKEEEAGSSSGGGSGKCMRTIHDVPDSYFGPAGTPHFSRLELIAQLTGGAAEVCVKRPEFQHPRLPPHDSHNMVPGVLPLENFIHPTGESPNNPKCFARPERATNGCIHIHAHDSCSRTCEANPKTYCAHHASTLAHALSRNATPEAVDAAVLRLGACERDCGVAGNFFKPLMTAHTGQRFVGSLPEEGDEGGGGGGGGGEGGKGGGGTAAAGADGGGGGGGGGHEEKSYGILPDDQRDVLQLFHFRRRPPGQQLEARAPNCRVAKLGALVRARLGMPPLQPQVLASCEEAKEREEEERRQAELEALSHAKNAVAAKLEAAEAAERALAAKRNQALQAAARAKPAGAEAQVNRVVVFWHVKNKDELVVDMFSTLRTALENRENVTVKWVTRDCPPTPPPPPPSGSSSASSAKRGEAGAVVATQEVEEEEEEEEEEAPALVLEQPSLAVREQLLAAAPLFQHHRAEGQFPCSPSHPDPLEGSTLSALYAHCASPRHATDFVAFVHTKSDDKARHYLGRAFLESPGFDTCVKGLNAGKAACGPHFYRAQKWPCDRSAPVPWCHFSGNWWMARCDHVRSLNPPVAAEDLSQGGRLNPALRDAKDARPFGRHLWEWWLLNDLPPHEYSPDAPLPPGGFTAETVLHANAYFNRTISRLAHVLQEHGCRAADGRKFFEGVPPEGMREFLEKRVAPQARDWMLVHFNGSFASLEGHCPALNGKLQSERILALSKSPFGQ